MIPNLAPRPASFSQGIHLVLPRGARAGKVNLTSPVGGGFQGSSLGLDLRLVDRSRRNTDDMGNSPSRKIVAAPPCSAHEDVLLASPLVFAVLTSSLLWRAIVVTARGIYSILVPVH